RIIILIGELTQKEIKKIKDYYINPVDSREASLLKPLTLEIAYPEPPDISICNGFTENSTEELKKIIEKYSLAMNMDDIKFCQSYFKEKEKRDPSITELKVIDTYWSDHCRHTTFSTKINRIDFEEGIFSKRIEKSYKNYLNSRKFVYDKRERDINLMDLATINMKEIRKKGLLNDLEISDEINACSIEVKVDINGKDEDWLIMFKNETHNHPTEIEPYGGAATCLGGAIRDPLSGRSYVYQGMRVTGSGDPRKKIEDTIEGKLPQIKITKEAAKGFSSYGNQIGLASGEIREYYNEGFLAKRMEVGAVIAAAPKENVKRERPVTGDIILLVGGKTGRDGCGGATGSSKVHNEESIEECSSEVQKGNPPEERKIQRLFREPEVSKLIKKCNDFGAGGVSVAIGELAEGLRINLDLIPKKYEGLDGTELAISESQERMAVLIDKQDKEEFINLAAKENLECTKVAEVTEEKRLVMTWRGKKILNISREFLDTNGVSQNTDVFVSEPDKLNYFTDFKSKMDLESKFLKNLKNLNVSSQKGLVEMFDSTVGAGNVLMPFGGKYKLTPVDGMVSKIPVEKGDTRSCTIMTHGYDPNLAIWSPYHGAMFAVISSVAKVVALGGDYKKIRLSLQEYFERLNFDSKKWGKSFGALLGAYDVQKNLNIPAIGGKDSMSGTFKDLNVPPTLISFAVCLSKVDNIISPELKKTGSKIVKISIKKSKDLTPNYEDMKTKYEEIHKLIINKKIISSSAIGYGGLAGSISKMCLGNKLGFKFVENYNLENIFVPTYGDIILEVEDLKDLSNLEYEMIGTTTKKNFISINNKNISLEEIKKSWEKTLGNIFKIKEDHYGEIKEFKFKNQENSKFKSINIVKGEKPKVFIPIFPGTNCEYDTGKAFEEAGGEIVYQVFKNQSSKDIEESLRMMSKNISRSKIIAIPGGFSAGDEPDGSGKFITSVFRNPNVSNSVMDLIKNKDGLMIGICNGFQALIKLGLLQYGEITDIKEDFPTLTFNKIGRHISTFAKTKITSDLSPWLSGCSLGDVHYIPISHGEGRFVANEEWIKRLERNGQISTQYVDDNNKPSYDGEFNPNSSFYAVESITSPDGKILGKMGHSERIGSNLYKNIYGDKDQKLFKSSIEYFKI
ncbi:MAG: phosphoribosylformylglycinamidine synthase, partial [Bacillota bacterium]|nr:phosphoribosylformylglycinamidine synthase [Bacillota bacterium]